MKKDSAATKRRAQEKSSLKSDDMDSSLESCVAIFLSKHKGDQSLGVFAAKLGIPKESLSRYINCEQSMTLGTLQKIANALGVKPNSILSNHKKRASG
jgi:transcriptional regulator with XRE-family HTH domain